MHENMKNLLHLLQSCAFAGRDEEKTENYDGFVPGKSFQDKRDLSSKQG